MGANLDFGHKEWHLRLKIFDQSDDWKQEQKQQQ